MKVKKHKRKQKENAREVCKNCGSPLFGPYCSNCGQQATDLNQSFWSFIKEYLGNAFQFDTRLLPTLKEMIIHPGKLTQEFFKGRINSYVHP